MTWIFKIILFGTSPLMLFWLDVISFKLLSLNLFLRQINVQEKENDINNILTSTIQWLIMTVHFAVKLLNGEMRP